MSRLAEFVFSVFILLNNLLYLKSSAAEKSKKAVKAFANTFFTKYLQLCPELPDNAAFYLQPLKRQKDDQWFSGQPGGKNPLDNTIKRMCAAESIWG